MSSDLNTFTNYTSTTTSSITGISCWPYQSTAGNPYQSGTSYVYPQTTGTQTYPQTINQPFTWVPPDLSVRIGSLKFDTKKDDDEKDMVVIELGDPKDCDHKIRLLPGVELYTPHPPPSRFRRFILKLLFGIEWKTTFEEKFIDAL